TFVVPVSPLSSSTSLMRQQRPQPSQRDSHSASVMSSRRLRRQNGVVSMDSEQNSPERPRGYPARLLTAIAARRRAVLAGAAAAAQILLAGGAVGGGLFVRHLFQGMP